MEYLLFPEIYLHTLDFNLNTIFTIFKFKKYKYIKVKQKICLDYMNLQKLKFV